MRLFIAINFDKEVKAQVLNIIDGIKGYSKKGSFVNKDHMHLTLEFLGEVPEDRVNDIKLAMNSITVEPFSIILSKVGFFKRDDGDICWLGIEENKNLKDLQADLHQHLKEKGFVLDSRDFTPHLTIGRKVKMDDIFNPDDFKEDVSQIRISISSLTLMKSENANGKLTHTGIYSKELK